MVHLPAALFERFRACVTDICCTVPHYSPLQLLVVQAAVGEVARKHEGIDLLFNNAGIQEGVEVSPLDL